MSSLTRAGLTRRSVVGASVAGGALVATTRMAPAAHAAYPAILKPTPADQFVDFGTNAEMRWDAVDSERYLTDQARLFVRNHTSTPLIDKSTWRLRIFGDGLTTPRPDSAALSLSFEDLRRLPRTTVESVHECTGNGRSFFATQQGTPAAGTAWKLGAVGTVVWEGVRLRDVLKKVGLSPEAVSIQATGLDPNYVTGGVDYGPVRRPFPVSKALDDAILAWGMNGAPLLPDHGYPLRLVLPGWVGIGSIKWLGSLEVAKTQLTSPWNTKWYVMTGGSYPPGAAAAFGQPGAVGLGAALPGRVARGQDRHADRPGLERAGADPAGRRQPRRRYDVASGQAPRPAGRAPPRPPGDPRLRLEPVLRQVEEAGRRLIRAAGPGHRRRRPPATADARRSTTTATSSTRP